MADSAVDPILIKFAQKLAGNEKKYRDLAMKKLRKWLSAKSHSSEDGMSRLDLIKIWKGLHYCMWMSDKPIIQEELASSIAGLLQCFQTFKQSMLFVDTFFETECREWNNIDRLRLDKFMMLIRQVFRRAVGLVKSHKWKKAYIRLLIQALQKSILTTDIEYGVPDGIRFHMVDMYLDELENADPQMKTDRIHMFLEPFCLLLTKIKVSRSEKLYNHIKKRLFLQIVEWKVQRMDIMSRNEDIMSRNEDIMSRNEAIREAAEEGQEEEEEEEEEEEIIPNHLQVNYTILADRLFELASDKDCPGKNRAHIYVLVKKLRDLSDGLLPNRLTINDIGEDISRKDINRAAQTMMEFERTIEKSTRKAHLKRVKNMKRKRAAKLEKTTVDEEDLEPVTKKRKASNEEGSPNSDKENSKGTQLEKKSKATKDTKSKATKDKKSKTTKDKELVNDNLNKSVVETSNTKHKKSKRKSLSKEVDNMESKEVVSDNMLEATENELVCEKSESVKRKKHKRSSEIGSASEATGESKDMQVNGIVVESSRINMAGVSEKESVEKPQSSHKTSKKHKRTSDIGLTLGSDVDICENVQSTKKDSKKKRRKSMGDVPDRHSEQSTSDLNTTEDAAMTSISQSDGTSITKPNKSPKQNKNKELVEFVKLKNKGEVNATEVEVGKDESMLFSGGFDNDSDDDIQMSTPKTTGRVKGRPKKRDAASSSRKGKHQSEADLVTFAKITMTPPAAFLKRAVSKMSTPKTEPRKSSNQLVVTEAPGSLSSLSRKKVIFDMKKNQAQDFNASLTVSPMVPYDPKQIPEQSILRSPAPRAKLFSKKRAKAADYF